MIKNLLILFSLFNPSIFAKRETDRLPEIHTHTETGHRRGRNKTRKLTPTAVTALTARSGQRLELQQRVELST